MTRTYNNFLSNYLSPLHTITCASPSFCILASVVPQLKINQETTVNSSDNRQQLSCLYHVFHIALKHQTYSLNLILLKGRRYC